MYYHDEAGADGLPLNIVGDFNMRFYIITSLVGARALFVEAIRTAEGAIQTSFFWSNGAACSTFSSQLRLSAYEETLIAIAYSQMVSKR